MGEPVEVVEGSSNAEISRLFPKCRPRLALTPTFNAHTTHPTTSDVNRNCVSADANDNYAVPTLASFHQPPMTSRRPHEQDHQHHNSSSSGDSSSSSSSRMSVDSAGVTPTSTPVSRSSSSYSAGGGSNPTFPPTGDRVPLGCLAPDNENDDLSVVSAYLDERFPTNSQPPPPPMPVALLDSSFEDPSAVPLGSPTSLVAPGVDAPASSVAPLVLRQHHFRLRDSRIESAGGKEVFSQSRSRPARKRHEGDARRPHHTHPQHHYNHHTHLHHHAAPPRPPVPTKQTPQGQYQIPPPAYPPAQVSADYLRKAGETSSTSRSHSSSSSGGGSSSDGGLCKDPPEEEGGASTFVYETRLSGSSEVVFDDIGEWVERGLTVREAPPGGRDAPRRSKHHQLQHFISATPPTPPSGSDRESEYDDVEDDDDDEDDDGEEDDETPLRITRIGGVQIAEYEGSPRRYGQPQRPARPGFPRRVGNCPAPGMVGTEERPRALLHPLEADKKGHHDDTLHMHRFSDKTHLKKPKARLGPHHHLHHHHHSQHQNQRLQHHQEQYHSPALPPEGVKANPSINLSFDKGIATAKLKEPPPCPSDPPASQAKEIGETEDCQRPPPSSGEEVRSSEESGETSSPITISISTLTSSYGSSLPHMPPTAIPGPSPPPTPLEHLPVGPVDKASDLYEEYRFEDSETRKVLEEFFLEARAQQPEFFDLEYTLKRQHGNSYVGQRLAAAECEDDDLQDAEDALPTKVLEAEDDDDREEEQEGTPNFRQRKRSSCNGAGDLGGLPQMTESPAGPQNARKSSVDQVEVGAAPPIAQENGNIPQENSQIGVSRNFTLSPETTSCDSLDVESEFSAGDGEGSIPSSGKVVSTMPVLEDGLSSGEESEIEIPSGEQKNFAVEDPQERLIRAHQLLMDQHHHLYHSSGGLQLYEESKEELVEVPGVESERERAFQRTRSLDNQLCRGELPPLNPSMMNHHLHTVSGLLAQPNTGGISPFTQVTGVNPFPDCALPHATSSPHAKHPPTVKSSATHSPSTSTLTLMKKQISEIEREIALKKPEGNLPPWKSPGEGGDAGPPQNLDLHLLDPLIKKVGEPPPPPAPHPHRGNNNGLENGTPHSSPPHNSSTSTSPSRVIGHLHSPQFTPVSDSVAVPRLLSTLGSLTSPGQVSPHMVPGHPATIDLQHKQGNGVSPSRESVEAAIADIKQAIRKTKNLPLKTHPQEKPDRGPVWLPRNNRRDLAYSKKHSSSPGVQTQGNSPQLHHHQDSSPSDGSNKSQDRSFHEEEDGDTDQETDRLLGQQRSDDGYLEEKNWSRIRPKAVVPMTTAPNHKEVDSEVGGLNSNESTPSTPSQHGSTNLTSSSPQNIHSSTKFVGKKEKEFGKKKGRSKEVMVHEPAVLIEGVLFRARYLGSTQLVSEGQPTKTTRMMQAEEAVSRIKAPEGEVQPSTEVDLFISTEKIMVLNTDLKEIMMDHALRTISYIADIGDLVVLMARRRVLPTDEQSDNPSHRIPKMICHVFESDEAQFIAQSIGQAFQVAYLEFLKANGIEDHSFVKEMDYQEVLNSQEIFGDELQMFAKKELQKEVVVPKMKGEILGVVVVESGWGSMVPTVVIANLSPTGAAAKCGQLNIGDQIIAINGISLVGLPLSNCQNYIKNTKYNTAVKLTVVPCPPVVEVKIRRPDTKYQLGFSVQNGVICSLLRGGIAERGGVRVGHRIIDINSQSVVAVPHEKIVNLLATSVGEIRMKTMPTSIFRLLTGQETPQYI